MTTTVERATGPLRLTTHPLQRCGAWAAAALADRSDPEAVTPADLDQVVDRMVDDVVTAATASNTAPAYDWWKVLFALYPNSKPTHQKRPRDRAVLRDLIAEMFAPDEGPGPWRPCVFCGATCVTVWAKSTLPMFGTSHSVNILPPDVAGWPVCRGCRVALWTLPYGAWLTAGSATVLSCANTDVERRFVRRNLARAARVRELGFSGVPALASAETVTLEALRVHTAATPVDTTLWTFKNDNQEPWLRVTVTRTAIARLLQRIPADPACRIGWTALRRALERTGKDGRVIASGYAEVARTLFDEEQRHTDRLLRVLHRHCAALDRVHASSVARTVDGWRRLARLYLEEMYGMDVAQLAPVRQLVTEWIKAESNRRGRFNEYQRVAASGYALHQLLMRAAARLYLDGHQPADVTKVTPALFANGQDGWRLRAQLFFEVIADLVKDGVEVGQKTGAADSETADEDVDAMRFDPVDTDDTEDYA